VTARRSVRLGGGVAAAGLAALAVAGAAGCGPELPVGSDVLWSARFEGGTFDEWTGALGRGVQAFPSDPNNKVEITTEHAHTGTSAVRLTIDASKVGVQESALLSRADDLPIEAYYSAWYYLPTSVSVGTYWVIFKFRQRAVASDGSTESELFDLDLTRQGNGDMSMVLFDHRAQRNLPLDVTDAVVPINRWFQVEAFYRNTADSTARLTYWLNGRQIKDLSGQTLAPSSWIEWDPCSVGETLDPSPAVLFIDDCAISRTRVGPDGVIAR
jgi:hypothetical protein